MKANVALFEHKEIRKIFHEEEWWFVITDVIAALTESTNPSEYLKKMRKRDPSLGEAFNGGTVAGSARRDLESKSGRKVVSRENYLDAPESVKRRRLPPAEA